MKTTTLGFIGGGRITRIFLQAFRNKSLEFDSTGVYEPVQEVASALKAQFPGITLESSPAGPARMDVVFLAVHPPVMMETLNNIREAFHPGSVVVSLAPKINIDRIAEVLETENVARMIPNATSYINKGYNPVCFHSNIPAEKIEQLWDLFRHLGKTIEVEESMLEGYAMISAMLPTYFWFQWKKMEEIALDMGFEKEEARKVIRNTLRRSIQLYYRSGLTPEEVMDLVPVKPIGEHEDQIREIFETRLPGLYSKIKP